MKTDFTKIDVTEFDLCACADASPELSIEAAPADGSVTRKRQFSMVAYNGGQMRVGGFWYPVVVDLSGLSISQKKKPIFLQHTQDIEYLLGQTSKLKIEDNTLVAEGKILAENDKCKQVMALNDAGYKWQASIGARVEEYQFIKEKETVTVNGKTFKGPMYCISKSSLGEISFVMLGADESTSAQIAATQIQESSTMKQDETKVEATTPQTETPKEVVAEAPKVDIQAQANDVIGEIRAASAKELGRIAEIGKVCDGEHAEIHAKAIADGWTPEKTELEVLRASRPTAPNAIIADSNISTDILEAATMMAGGIKGDDLLDSHGEEVVASADKHFRGRIGLQQLVMECARQNGCSVQYFKDDPRKVLQAAFSTQGASTIMANIANKFLLKGYMGVESGYERISASRSVKDFKQITSYRLNGGFEFDEVGPDGELKHATISDESLTNQAKTYGRMFSVTRQDLINDDLGALSAVPTRIGRGGALKLNTVFWTEFMADAGTFYTTGRGNYASGAATALDIDALTAADLLFMNQTDADGYPMSISPQILLTPNALKVTAKKLMHDTEVRNTTSSTEYTTGNPHAGAYDVICSSYLSNSAITGNSTTAYYLMASPSDIPVIEIVYLNGVKSPTVESADADFNTLGIQMRGFFDFGVAKQEYRGAVKMAGA